MACSGRSEGGSECTSEPPVSAPQGHTRGHIRRHILYMPQFLTDIPAKPLRCLPFRMTRPSGSRHDQMPFSPLRFALPSAFSWRPRWLFKPRCAPARKRPRAPCRCVCRRSFDLLHSYRQGWGQRHLVVALRANDGRSCGTIDRPRAAGQCRRAASTTRTGRSAGTMHEESSSCAKAAFRHRPAGLQRVDPLRHGSRSAL